MDQFKGSEPRALVVGASLRAETPLETLLFVEISYHAYKHTPTQLYVHVFNHVDKKATHVRIYSQNS